jgi:hypothetical protein
MTANRPIRLSSTFALLQVLLAFVGCNTSGTPGNHAPTKIVIDDEADVRMCVNGWLDCQMKEHRGEAFFDPYVTMPLDAPNQNAYTKQLVAAISAIKDVEDSEQKSEIRSGLEDGRKFEIIPHSKTYYQKTVEEVDDITCVRKWDFIDVQLIDLTQKQQLDCGRQRRATVKVRIESSKEDGTAIIKVWTVELFKNQGRWGVRSVGA